MLSPVTRARLAEIGVLTIGQLAKTPSWSLERLLGPAAAEKLAALSWNRDPRDIKIDRRAASAGAQSALGRKPAEEHVYRPTLLHLADRVATRLRARSKPGRTVTARVRFANLGSATRSVTLDAPISATAILAEIAEELVRAILADHPREKSKTRLEHHAVLGPGICQPGDALLARWTCDHLASPIDLKLSLDEPVARARLPTRIVGDGTDNGDIVPLPAVDQNA
jgi:nucleotidyltransferase/DNA polymerase involved in DNA repair